MNAPGAFEQTPGDFARHPLKLLVVEDNPADVRLIQEYLAEAALTHIELNLTSTLEETLSTLSTMPVDVVLLDLGLPDSQGLATFNSLQRYTDSLPIIVLTGFGDDDIALQALKSGAEDYLVKNDLTGATLFRSLSYAVERKRLQQELARNEARFRSLIESSSDIVTLLDPSGTILYESPPIKTVLGYTPHERLGQNAFAYIHPEDVARVREAFETTLREGRGSSPEFRVRKADGSWAWLDVVGTNLLDDPNVGAIVANSRDVSARKEATDAFIASKARWQSLIQHSSDLITLIARDGTILYQSPSVHHLFGYDAGTVVGKNAFGYLHPDDTEALRVSFQEILQEGRAEVTTYRVRTATGAWLWLETIGMNLLDDPNVAAIVLNSRDVTERRRIEQEREGILYRMQQRVKELTAVHHAAKILRDDRKPLRDTLQELIALLPEAFQHTHAATARLTLDDLQVITPGFMETPWTLAADFSIVEDPAQQGRLEVAYLEPCPDADEGPFLNEERALLESLAELLRWYVERRQSREAIEKLNHDLVQQLERLTALHGIDTVITSSLDLNFSLERIAEQVRGNLKVDAVHVALYRPILKTFEHGTSQGFHTSMVKTLTFRLGEGYIGQAALERKPVFFPDISQMDPPFFPREAITQEGFVSYYIVPLISKGELQGVLGLLHREKLEPDEGWFNFSRALALQAAIAIDGATLFQNLQRANNELVLAYDRTIEGWARALDLKDEESAGHSRRVTELSVRLAERFGLRGEALADVRRGALLHDIGKMGVPDAILLKEGKLSEEEWAVMKSHTSYAYQLLSPITFLRRAIDIPHAHHEKWNGSGYPRGLKGEQIPLAARIFAVVDVYDALTSDRPYRKAWSEAKTLAHIQAQSGSHFDPKVVKTFLELLEEKR